MAAGHVVLRRLDGGVNLFSASREIGDDELAHAADTIITSPGVIGPRPNSDSTYKSAGVVQPLVVGPVGQADAAILFSFIDNLGFTHVIAWVEQWDVLGQSAIVEVTQSWQGNAGGLVIHYTNAGAGVARAAAGPRERPAVIIYNNVAWIFPGEDVPAIKLDAAFALAHGFFDPKTGLFQPDPATDGTVYQGPSNWGGALEANIRPTVATMYQDQLVLAAGLGNPQGMMDDGTLIDASSLIFCDTRTNGGPDKLLDAAHGLISVSDDPSDPIVALQQIDVVGGATYNQPYLLILKRWSTWMFQGNPPNSTTVAVPTIVPVMNDQGCVTKETVCRTPFGIIWCSGDNVYLMPPGSIPVRLGDAIYRLLRTLPWSDRTAWHAQYHDGWYKLVVPSPRGNAGFGAQVEEWWLDMREYPKRHTWWGPMTLTSNAGCVVRLPNGQRQRLQLVIAQDPVNGNFPYLVDSAAKYDGNGDDFGFSLGQFANYQQMAQLWKMKEFDLGDPCLAKLMDGFELAYTQTVGGLDPIVTMVRDGGGGSDLFVIAPKTVADPANATLGSIVLTATGTVAPNESYRANLYVPPNGGRSVAKSFQPVVAAQSAGPMSSRGAALRIRPIAKRPE